MSELPNKLQADVKAVGLIPIINSLLEVVCRTTGMGFAAVARVTDTKWIACSVRDEINFGLKPGGELVLETTICHEIRQSGNAVVIDEVSKDPFFAQHDTPAMYGFQSYISVPIMLKDGSFFGTLCAIDPNPANLQTPEIIGMFKLFAELISFHLHAQDELAAAEEKLLQERKTAELREQFIAILGHDLRNPVTAVMNGVELLEQLSNDGDILKLAGIMKTSTFRITGLIENMLDFARGRLGEGITLEIKSHRDLSATLNHVVNEVRSAWPQHEIVTSFSLNAPVKVDENRIGQLLSNLLNNAATHGSADAPISITAESNEEIFKLSVSNSGNKIPDAAMEKLFQPFYRAAIKPGQQGLGLGLYIASEIAKAHDATLNVVSNDDATTFTFLMNNR